MEGAIARRYVLLRAGTGNHTGYARLEVRHGRGSVSLRVSLPGRNGTIRALLLAGDVSGLTPQARETLFWELAQYEHLRWNAFHFARGWLPLPQEELTREEREQCRIKRPLEKRHACLVDWDQLDGLPQREPGILKRYDYENVAYLFSAAQEKA